MWNKLSMKDRAKCIKLGVSSGITSLRSIKNAYNELANGGNLEITLPELVVTPESSYIRYSGEESNTPTINDYIQAKIDETRHDAYLSMLKQHKPLIPRVPDRKNKIKALGASVLDILGFDTEDIINVVGLDNNAFTCAWTSTGQYPESSRVSGNKTFAENYRKYGFVKSNKSKVGDLMVAHRNETFVPYHMTMVTGFDDYNNPLLSYSDGGHNPENMVHNRGEWQEDFPNIITYTYTGTEEEKNKWKSEYKKLYKK